MTGSPYEAVIHRLARPEHLYTYTEYPTDTALIVECRSSVKDSLDVVSVKISLQTWPSPLLLALN